MLQKHGMRCFITLEYVSCLKCFVSSGSPIKETHLHVFLFFVSLTESLELLCNKCHRWYDDISIRMIPPKDLLAPLMVHVVSREITSAVFFLCLYRKPDDCSGTDQFRSLILTHLFHPVKRLFIHCHSQAFGITEYKLYLFRSDTQGAPDKKIVHNYRICGCEVPLILSVAMASLKWPRRTKFILKGASHLKYYITGIFCRNSGTFSWALTAFKKVLNVLSYLYHIQEAVL